MDMTFDRDLNCFMFSLWNKDYLHNFEFIKKMRDELIHCLTRFPLTDVFELFDDHVSMSYGTNVHNREMNIKDIFSINKIFENFYEGCKNGHRYDMNYYECEMDYGDEYKDLIKPFDYEDYKIKKVTVYMPICRTFLERDDYNELVNDLIDRYRGLDID